MSFVEYMTKRKYPKRIFNCLRCRDKNWLVECGDGCGEPIPLFSKKGNPRMFVNGGHSQTGKQSPNWKGGRRLRGKYWTIWKPNYLRNQKEGYVNEHVFLFQEYHKCCMLAWGEIHHLDGHPEMDDGNRMENMIGVMKAEHVRIHMLGNQYRKTDMSNRRCSDPDCKSPDKTYINKKGVHCWYNDGKGGFICSKCYWFKKKK
jgi:hypothetical protein